jgi:hypothetical protein
MMMMMMMRQSHQPFAGFIVPMSTVCENWLSYAISIPKLLEKLITNKNRPSFSR